MSEQLENTMTQLTIEEEVAFPQPTPRLQELMDNYRKENGIVPTQTAKKPVVTAKVSNEMVAKDFNSLKPEEQKKVLAMIDGVDYLSSGDIQMFGSSNESPMTKNAEVIISQYTSGDAAEITAPMNELVATLRTHNTKEITSKVKGMDRKEGGFLATFMDTFSMKNAKKKLAIALAEHSTIQQNIGVIKTEIKKRQVALLKDVKVYEEMGRNTLVQIKDFEYACIALQLMIDDATAKLAAINGKGEITLEEQFEATNLQNAIERMKKRQYSIMSVRVSTIQSLPQLAFLIRDDNIIIEKIDEIESLVLPLWTWQYAIAVGAIKQQEALEIQKSIRGITSNLLRGNAKLIHDNLIAAQEELNATAVAIEDLQVVQDYINDMVEKVSESSKVLAQKTVEGMKTMKQIEQQNMAIMSKSVEISIGTAGNN